MKQESYQLSPRNDNNYGFASPQASAIKTAPIIPCCDKFTELDKEISDMNFAHRSEIRMK